MERNILADRLKGYACFLVLFGHVILGMRSGGVKVPAVFPALESFIWSYHVPLFLFLSGAVYKITGAWKSKQTKAAFIRHKAISLGVPYVVFSVVYILINSLVGQTNTHSSLWDLLYIWKTPVAQYWYLYALFFLFVIWTVFAGTLKNWQITIFVTLAGYVAPFFGVQFGCFEVVIFSALAFGLGTCLDITKLTQISLWLKCVVVVLHIIVGAVLIWAQWIEKPIATELVMVLGIYASILLISVAQRFAPVSWYLDFMNRYSLQIYLLHTIFTAGVRIVLLRLVVTNWVVHLIIGCAAGLGCSVLAALIAAKIPWMQFCFFPTKVLSAWKKSR